jgi:flagellar biosynthesis GTPase FlhF
LQAGIDFGPRPGLHNDAVSFLSPPGTFVSSISSGVKMERSLRSVRIPERNQVLDRFLGMLAAESSNEEAIYPCVRTECQSEKDSANAKQVVACQILLTLRQINLAQWRAIIDILKCMHASSSKFCASKIVVNGPPATGKTTTIAKLLSLL